MSSKSHSGAAGGSQLHKEGRGGRGRWRWCRENLEAVVGAVTVALLIRTFAAEPYSIPTGSMSPTLLGAHIETDCPSCGASLDTAPSIASSEQTRRRACPNCAIVGEAGQDCSACGRPLPPGGTSLAPSPAARCPRCLESLPDRGSPGVASRGGDKILVDKVTYRFRDPERWDVAVFRRPGQTSINFIKRVVGLPEEEIDLVGGDVLVDGKIAAKPPPLQERLWFPVYSSSLRRPGLDVWRTESGWAKEQGILTAKSGEAETRAWYDRPIMDRQQYNALRGGDGEHRVGDLRLTAEVEIEDGEALLILGRNGKEVVASLDRTGHLSLLAAGERRVARSEPVSGPVKWSLEVIDGRVRVRVEGEEKIRLPLPWAPERVRRTRTGIGVRAGAARFLGLEIHRDIHYFQPRDALLDFPVRVGRDEYLMFGDNSPSSKDSRYLGMVPADNIVGRALVVMWPIAPWRVHRIR